MSLLDTPFRFIHLPKEELTIPNVSSLQESSEIEASELRNETEHCIIHQCDLEVTIRNEISSTNRLKHLVVRHCAGITVYTETPFASAQLAAIENSTIHFSVVKGSVSLTSCKNVCIVGFCSQLRLTDCINVEIRAQTASSTALVNSKDIRVFPPPDVDNLSKIHHWLKILGMHEEAYLKSLKWKSVVDFDSLGNNAGSFTIHE